MARIVCRIAAARRASLAALAQLAVVATAASACGGDPATGGTCSAVAACGGDVAGTWQIDGECLAIASPFAEPACQKAVDRSTVTIQGTVVYAPAGDDATTGTQTLDLTYALTIDETYSSACLAAIGLQGASPQACAGLQAYWTGPYAVNCTPAGDTCECRFDDQNTIHESDTYSVANEQLTLDASGPVDYCRRSDTLTESSLSGLSTSRLTMHRVP
jgi:hypothetical protein